MVNFVNLASVEGTLDESEVSFTACAFTNNVNAATNFYNVIFDGCTFKNNQFAITQSKMITVTGSTFSNSQECLQGEGIKVSLSSFTNCDLAVNSDGTDVPLNMDQVAINGGKTALAVNELSDATVTNSNFIGATQLSSGHFQGKISGNYWGTVTIADIISKIDWDVGAAGVKALISPIATAPNGISVPDQKRS